MSAHLPDTPESSKSDLHHLAEVEEDGDKQRSTLTMASFNFINSIIGSGIIGMPYALKQAGFGMGILLVILVTGITDYSLVLLIHGGELSNRNTYQLLHYSRRGFVFPVVIQGLCQLLRQPLKICIIKLLVFCPPEKLRPQD
ncbi:putative sodium-coupled neutral amino acid transporter 11 [Lamellibrachia satsuma]|nr:putative sodium-coupled neutral amino acid transporter 11 [Lamellibrachia satsuma]